MKPLFRSALPPFDKSSRLPLLMAALLAVALVVQLMASGDDSMPPAAPMRFGAGQGERLPQLPPAKGGPAIIARKLFEPIVSSSQPGGVPAGPLVIGTIQVGRRIAAVLEEPDGRIAHIHPGGRIGDWRLLRVTQNAVLLDRGGERQTVPFGGRVVPQSIPVERGNQ